jgi:hypothetical protein
MEVYFKKTEPQISESTLGLPLLDANYYRKMERSSTDTDFTLCGMRLYSYVSNTCSNSHGAGKSIEKHPNVFAVSILSKLDILHRLLTVRTTYLKCRDEVGCRWEPNSSGMHPFASSKRYKIRSNVIALASLHNSSANTPMLVTIARSFYTTKQTSHSKNEQS